MADELRHRAQPLLDRPPYEPLPIEELRERAAGRRQRARRRLGAGLGALAVIGGTVGFVATNHHRSSNGVVAVRTTGTAPVVTVPATTSVTNLRFQEIPGPDGGTPVQLFAAGDRFLAVSGDSVVARAWVGDDAGHWREIQVPAGLVGANMGTVEQVGDRIVVIATTRSGPIVFTGRSFDDLRESPWTAGAAALPATIDPPPPSGPGIVVTGAVDTTAVGARGIVLAGRVFAEFDRSLLPQSVRDALARQPSRVDVRDGRVIVAMAEGGVLVTLFDRPASSLGLSAAAVDYLSSGVDHTEIAVWGAAWGATVRQLPANGIDVGERLGNVALSRASDGFVLSAPTAGAGVMYWSRDGRDWRRLAAPPRDPVGLLEIGSRWVVASAGIASDDEGRSWTPIDLTGDLAAHSGSTLFTPAGTSGFGLLGASNALDVPSLTVSAGRLLYSPDGVHWSAIGLADALGFDANIPMIAVGDTAAMLETGLRAPGAQAQRFWVVTLSR